MQNLYRWFVSVTAAVVCALISAGVTTRANDNPHWRIGDVFVGVGSEMSPNGSYVVYDADGQPKETLTNKIGQFVMTTGCAIAPPVPGLDEALYGTNFFGASWADPLVFPETNFGPSVTRLSADHPHAASLAPYQIPRADVIATESIVFDAQGSAYLGGIVGPFDGTLYANGYIFKYDATGALLETFEVPNENKGADWIDLDIDPVTGARTLYYTSEGQRVHWYKPDEPNVLNRTGSLPIREWGATDPVGGSAYAMRVLPRLADGTPGGFLVAMSDSIVRLDAQGFIVKRYNAFKGTPSPGTFFALNISPDGQTFWTATEQPDTEVATKGAKDQTDPVTGYPIPVAPARAYIYKFHIGTGERLLGPIDTSLSVSSAFSVKGLCIKREYTAAINQCVKTDLDGNPILDANGHEQFETCQAREICSGNRPGDDDGDGQPDATDRDCAVPGSPRFQFTIDSTSSYIGETVTAYPVINGDLAVSPRNLPLTYALAGEPAGITINPATGIMSGTISVAQAQTFLVTVTASDGTLSASTQFQWEIRPSPINLPPTLSPPSAWSSTHPATPFTVAALRPQTFSLPFRDPEGATVWVIASHSSDGGATFLPGLPAGYQFTNVFPDTVEIRSPWIGVPSDYAVAGLKPSWSGPTINIAATLPIEGQYLVRVAITEDFEKGGCAPAPSCTPQTQPERSWSDAAQQFAFSVVNSAPEFAVAPQLSIVGRPATPYAINATDADGHAVTYSLAPGSDLPPGITLSGNTFSGVPSQEGLYNVIVTVTDETGASTTKNFLWTVKLNNAPVCGGARPTEVLWPPNHKLVEIGITGVTDEDPFDTITITVTDILQDEPVKVIGSGATNDFDGVKAGATAWVRAERTGVPGVPGDGRVYQILFTATDGKESCSGVVTVGIPHDWRQPHMPIANGTWWDSVTGLPR